MVTSKVFNASKGFTTFQTCSPQENHETRYTRGTVTRAIGMARSPRFLVDGALGVESTETAEAADVAWRM